MASATGPVNPPCGLLDLQSLPSLERFDSRFLDIFRDSGNEAGAGGVPVMDELQAPDDDLALQRLMSLRNGQHKAAAFSRLQHCDFAEAPAHHQHSTHSPDTPHAQPPQQQHLHHGGSSNNYTNMSGDPNQQPQSSSGMEGCAVSSAAVAAAGGYDLNLNSSQLAAAQQYMMSQAAAAAGADGSRGYGNGAAGGMQHMAMSMAAAMPASSDMMPIGSNTAHASSFAPSAAVPFGVSGIDLTSLAAADCNDPQSPLAGAFAGHHHLAGNDAGTPGGKRRSRGARLDDYVKAEQDNAALMMMDCDGSLANLLGEGAAALAGMGEQLHQLEMEERAAAGGSNKRSRGSRGQAVQHDFGGDSDFEGQEARAGALSITPDMDEDTRARIRREKNRVAARKCRAKKMAFMVELQKTLRELMRKNEEYRLQVITWHKMFSREVRLREAMKRIIAVMWQSGVAPAASGYTANDVIIGLESGTLDVNSLVRALANLNAAPAHSGLSINTAAAAAAAELAGQVNAHTSQHAQHAAGNSPTHGLPPPAPLVLGSPTAAAAAAAVASHMAAGGAPAGVGVPVTPHAAAAANQLLALQQQQQGSEGAGELCNSMGGDRSAADVLPGIGEGTGGTGGAAGGTGACSSPLSGEHTEATLPMSLLSAQYSHISHTSTAALPGSFSGQHGSAAHMQMAMSKYAAAAAANGNDVGMAAAAAAAAGYGGVAGLPDLAEHGGGGNAAVFAAGLEGYMLGGGGGVNVQGGVAGSGPSCITTGAHE